MIDRAAIEKHVDDGMHYLENMESIELDSYFDLRVEAGIIQMEREARVNRVPVLVRSLRLGVIGLLCILNLVAVVYAFHLFPGRMKPIAPTPDGDVTSIEATYSVDQNSLDMEILKIMKETSKGEKNVTGKK
ncbi:MAG: hypothetical protein ACM3SY_12080 [Candidatus Omnitrophota bacterium]